MTTRKYPHTPEISCSFWVYPLVGNNQGCQSNPIDGNHRLSIVIFSTDWIIDWIVRYFVDWIIDWIVQYFVDWIIIDEFSSIFSIISDLLVD